MILTHFKHVLLFIEPMNPPTEESVNDDYTLYVEECLMRAMRESGEQMWTLNVRVGESGDKPRPRDEQLCFGSVKPDGFFHQGARAGGVHRCVCGMMSTSYDYWIGRGLFTHSLALHYLQYHRAEVPASELGKIMRAMRFEDYHKTVAQCNAEVGYGAPQRRITRPRPRTTPTRGHRGGRMTRHT